MVDKATATEPRVKELVTGLNACVAHYASPDRQALIALLQAAAQKKTTMGLLLGDAQIKAINQAIISLQNVH